ncbi:Guanylate kinase [Lachnospiraceae bacterium KHCPX20]|nr:Guanylate kinase [Lachnospiraceae bacterium KHCPX20]
MSKIYMIMGKSATGKDTIYARLMKRRDLKLKKIVPYTTRPMREGETDGVTYHFCSDQKLAELTEAGKVVEKRTYQTVYGPWNYFTVDDDQIDLTKQQDYLIIGTLEAFTHIRNYYGKRRVVPIYIEVEDGIRLTRALGREKKQKEPKYDEMCRRFLADQQDFSEENLKKAGVRKRFVNLSLKTTVDVIAAYIKKGR